MPWRLIRLLILIAIVTLPVILNRPPSPRDANGHSHSSVLQLSGVVVHTYEDREVFRRLETRKGVFVLRYQGIITLMDEAGTPYFIYCWVDEDDELPVEPGDWVECRVEAKSWRLIHIDQRQPSRPQTTAALAPHRFGDWCGAAFSYFKWTKLGIILGTMCEKRAFY